MVTDIYILAEFSHFTLMHGNFEAVQILEKYK